MKLRCHLCGKITADIKDASIAKGTVLICPCCADDLFRKREKRSDAVDSIPGFMSDFFRGMRR